MPPRFRRGPMFSPNLHPLITAGGVAKELAGKAVLLRSLLCNARLLLRAARLAGSEILRRLSLLATLQAALLGPL